MANSIDIGAIALGAALGYGLRNEIKSSAGVCKSALLAAATVAAATATAAVDGAKKAEETQSPEQKKADAWLSQMDQQIQGQTNGNTNNGGNV